MLTISGVIFFAAVFVWLIHRTIRKHPERLTLPELSIAFGFKVVCGCLYGYIFLHYYGGDDTWYLQRDSLQAYQRLVNHPVQFFFYEFYPVRFSSFSSFGEGLQFYLWLLEDNLQVKLLALFNIFSRGNYYINVVFFNAIVFWGHYWLFRLLVREFPAKRKLLFPVIFLFPPAIFWLSGIRADGLLLFFITLLLHHYHLWLYEKRTGSLVRVLAAIAGIIILRKEWVLLLLPCMLAWYLVARWRRLPVLTFLLVYCISGILFFSTTLLSPVNNLPATVVKRQQQFMALKGTAFQLDSLDTSVASFARVLPQAVSHTFLRPFIWEAKGLLQIITALDILFFWLLLLVCLFKNDRRGRYYLQHPLLLTLLFFSLSLYLINGYIVPYPGAIVRYKIVGELFLFILLVLTLKIKNQTTD